MLDRLRATGVVAILRGGDGRHVERVAATLVETGVACVEITTNTPGWADAVTGLRASYDDAVVGVGTVLTGDDVARAADAGATFVVAPNTDEAVGAAADRAGLGWLPGAFTPTEVVRAWRAGATAVKLFPAAEAGGPAYLAALRAPLADVPIIPTGGVDAGQAVAYLRGGAVAVGAGSPLLGDALSTGDLDGVRRRARRFLDAIAEARS
jgi:2-dehydro-3-deoxyphosphogluconate aldolase/(4S)-4-hydroxy-2-oxoglutarate aldolase